MDLSNCNIDDSKTCNNGNIGMKAAYHFLNNFPLFFSVFININEYANYENTTTWIFDHEMKVLCPSINLVPLLVVYDKSR